MIIGNEFVAALETELRREDEDFRDLMNDFEFVKDLNKELSLKYQDFVDSIPKPAEIDVILKKLNADFKLARVNFESVVDPELIEKYKNECAAIEKRLFQMNRFRTAAVMLEKEDPKKLSLSYEELFGK
jgi:hypothetical protein